MRPDKFLLPVLLLLHAGGGARRYTTAARETTFHEDSSRRVGVTGRRGAAVPVEAGPARGQPDHQGGLENGVHTPAVSWK